MISEVGLLMHWRSTFDAHFSTILVGVAINGGMDIVTIRRLKDSIIKCFFIDSSMSETH